MKRNKPTGARIVTRPLFESDDKVIEYFEHAVNYYGLPVLLNKPNGGFVAIHTLVDGYNNHFELDTRYEWALGFKNYLLSLVDAGTLEDWRDSDAVQPILTKPYKYSRGKDILPTFANSSDRKY